MSEVENASGGANDTAAEERVDVSASDQGAAAEHFGDPTPTEVEGGGPAQIADGASAAPEAAAEAAAVIVDQTAEEASVPDGGSAQDAEAAASNDASAKDADGSSPSASAGVDAAEGADADANAPAVAEDSTVAGADVPAAAAAAADDDDDDSGGAVVAAAAAESSVSAPVVNDENAAPCPEKVFAEENRTSGDIEFTKLIGCKFRCRSPYLHFLLVWNSLSVPFV
jgi:hypothetical protein